MIRGGGPRGNRVFFFPRPRCGRAPAAARSLPAGRVWASVSAAGLLPHGGGRGPGGGDPRQQYPRAPRAARLPCSTSAAGPVVHPVPPTKKSARPSVPPLRALSRPRAQSELRRGRRPDQKLEIRKEGEPGESRWPGLGSPISSRAIKKVEKRDCPLGETSISSFQKRS